MTEHLTATPQAMDPPSLEYRLVLVAGPELVGTSIPLWETSTTTIGRDSECTLVLRSQRVSPLHARIRHESLTWMLYAGQTTGGHESLIVVNDARCSERDLGDGDRIDIGGHRFVFENVLAGADDLLVADGTITLRVRGGVAVADPVFTARVGESILVGHSQTALWMLQDRNVSRHHCRIEVIDGVWMVRDLESRNGTFVNGRRVQLHALQNGDRLLLGRCDVEVAIHD